MSATKNGTARPCCRECGGENIQTSAWIAYDAEGIEYVVNSEGPLSDESGNWCEDCEQNVDIEYPEEMFTPEASQARLRVQAERDAGPGAVAALRELASWFRQQLGSGTPNEAEPLLAGCPNELAAVVAKARKILSDLGG